MLAVEYLPECYWKYHYYLQSPDEETGPEMLNNLPDLHSSLSVELEFRLHKADLEPEFKTTYLVIFGKMQEAAEQ